MKKPILAIRALILASLSCGQYITPAPAVSPEPTQTQWAAVIPTDTAAPLPTPAPSSTDTVAEVIRVSVNVHTTADINSPVSGYVYGGQDVRILECSADMCRISTDALVGWVWRGCLSGNEDKGCASK